MIIINGVRMTIAEFEAADGLSVGGSLHLPGTPYLAARGVGVDRRGYYFVPVKLRNGWRVIAGCRNFSAEEARAHWPEGSECRGLAEQCIAQFEEFSSMSENPIGGPIYVHGATLAYNDICAERIRQDVQWGGPAHDDGHAAHHWLEFIDRQMTKAVVTDEGDFSRDPVQIRARLVKIGALAVAGLQAIDRAAMAKPKSTEVSPAMKSALRALFEAGDGSIQAKGILAAGEMLPFDGKTWLRLQASGLVEVGGTRIRPTEQGRYMAERLPAYEGAATNG